jgi:2-haloacid dehalogenase
VLASGAMNSPGPATSPPAVSTIVFDLGGVLIDWDPRHLYRSLFADEAAMEDFLASVTTPEWNRQQDAGRPWAEAIEELATRHPDRRELIEAYRRRWPEMLGGPIEPTVALLEDLCATNLRLYALSNWSAETFAIARPSFPFLEWFDALVISGHEKVIKPDERIFRLLLERYALDPRTTVFVDDHETNVEAARRLGIRGIRFVDAAALRVELVRLGIPIEETRSTG